MQTFLQLGLEHITDVNGYDHILFLLALCATFQIQQWKPMLILVTAFTLGHSLTLALAAFQIIRLPGELIEALIPVTIILTGLHNLLRPGTRTFNWQKYLLALGFGLIHGLAFSNFFKAIMGESGSLVKPLLFFNLGVEAGQLLIVAAILAINTILVVWLGLRQKWWVWGVSLIAIVLATWLLLDSSLLHGG